MTDVDWFAVLLGLAAVTWGTLAVFALLAAAMWREERRNRSRRRHPSLTRLTSDNDFDLWETEPTYQGETQP